MRIRLSDAEQRDGQLSSQSLAEAVRLIRDLGAVIIESGIPLDLLADIRRAFIEDAPGEGRLHPKKLPYCDPSIIANPYALAVLETVMGRKIALAGYQINKADPGTGREGGASRGGSHLFPELACPLPPSCIQMAVPSGDWTKEDGAQRIWPGSHLIMDQPPSDVKNVSVRARHLPSVRTTMEQGSLLLTDLRLWHTGMPNTTDHATLTMNIRYVRVFAHSHERYALPENVRRKLPPAARRILRTASSEGPPQG